MYTTTPSSDNGMAGETGRRRLRRAIGEVTAETDTRERLVTAYESLRGSKVTSPDYTSVNGDNISRDRTSRMSPNINSLASSPRMEQGSALNSRPGTSANNNSTDYVISRPSKRQPIVAPTEAALLRDLTFTLQGLRSSTLPFKDNKCLQLPPALSIPLTGLLNVLAEPSLLYKNLTIYTAGTTGGLIVQSLRSAINEELQAYLGLIATLEGHIRKALSQVDEDKSSRALGKAGISLKRCVIWTREATLGLRLMSMIIEEADGMKGGPIISLVHRLATCHGDPFVHTFATRLLHKVTKPFYGMLQSWMFSGELTDSYQEFFVSRNNDVDEESAASIWTDRYTLEEELIPSILSLDLAKQVFLIGKSLDFIRSSCSDSTWLEEYTSDTSQTLSFSDQKGLQTAISTAYQRTSARVLHLMSNKFNLFLHLSALKKYLLLGQGDFIAILLDSLASNLDGPANSQYRHHLTSALDHSIRNSNAQFESPDVTRRLDARMLELSHGEIGWDVFTLEYRMDSPLDVVVGPWAQKQYLKIFNFLWRIKRVEFTLGHIYGRCMTGGRGVLRFIFECGSEKGKGSQKMSESDVQLAEIWKRARGILASMIHFVGQLQYYILFEVIESGWEKLQSEINKPNATLDTLISAHNVYLLDITRKGLLAPSSSSNTAQNQPQTYATNQPTIDFTSQLHALLKLMLAYNGALEMLYSHSVAEYTRRQTPSTTSSSRKPSRTYEEKITPLIPLSSDTVTDDKGNVSTELDRRLLTLEAEFKDRVGVLLADLAYQHYDADMRFLGVAMNFNDFYRVVRRRKA